jgi:TolB protein
VRPDGSGLFYLTALPTEAVSSAARWLGDSILVYASNRSGSYDLWIRGAPDSTARRLTAFAEDELDPAPRPGAPGIAYTEGSALAGRITLIPDTVVVPPARVYLTDASMRAGEASWDPVGARLCFTAGGTGGSRHVWLISLASGDSTPVQLTTGPHVDRSPRFSPDGAAILFASADRLSKPSLWLVSPAGEGTSLRAIAQDDSLPGTPDWSPDGSRVVVSSSRLGFGRCLWVLSNLP